MGPYLQLRPLAGGRERDAGPQHVQPLTGAELLHARLAEATERSRVRILLGTDVGAPP